MTGFSNAFMLLGAASMTLSVVSDSVAALECAKSSGTDPKITGFYAGVLSLAEIGLGSLLHGLKIPMTGTFLSINQALFLTRVVKLNRANDDVRTLPFRVSNITALLKSLSPAGKKLLPMLAIAAQGLLFTAGTIIFGPNLIGCMAGAAMLAVWGVFQPVAILWLIYGLVLGEDQLAKIFAYYSKLLSGVVEINSGFQDQVIRVILVFVAIKSLVCMAVCLAGWRAEVNEQQLLSERLVKLGLKGLPRGDVALPSAASGPSKGFFKAFKGALNDIRRPLFIVPLIMTGIFFWFAEDELAPILWGVFRPMAAGYLLFLAIRLFPVETWIKRAGLGGTALAAAVDVINGSR